MDQYGKKQSKAYFPQPIKSWEEIICNAEPFDPKVHGLCGSNADTVELGWETPQQCKTGR